MTHEQSWERWQAGWQHAFFAVVLTLTTLGAVTNTSDDARPLAAQLALVAMLGAWYAYWFVVRSDTGAAHLPYLLGAAALWAVMAAFDPALLWVGASALIPYCMRHILWAVAGVVMTVVAAWLWQGFVTDGAISWSRVLSCTLGILAVVAIAGYIAELDREGRIRQELLDELVAAQAELAAAERHTGALAERQRLARDIHDTLTQGFASISMLLDAALADLPPKAPASRRVSQAMRTARDNLAESRRLIEALRPVQLDETRLPQAIEQLTSHLGDETGIAAETVVAGDPGTLDSTVEAELLRVVQEALTNVRRHAGAQQVTVTISYLDDVVVIDVHDNGSGFNDDASPTGVGLTAMQERMEGLGGSLTIESTPGEGTTVVFAVPVPPAAQPPAAGTPAAGTDAANRWLAVQ